MGSMSTTRSGPHDRIGPVEERSYRASLLENVDLLARHRRRRRRLRDRRDPAAVARVRRRARVGAARIPTPRCRHRALRSHLDLGPRAWARHDPDHRRRRRPREPRVRATARLRRGEPRERRLARPDADRAAHRRAARRRRDRHVGRASRARARDVRGRARGGSRHPRRARTNRSSRSRTGSRTTCKAPGDRPEATFVAVAGDEVIGYAKFSLSAAQSDDGAPRPHRASSARGEAAASRVR